MKELTPTSHVILGLLAVKPWSAYELAKQMRRAVWHFWPRAERMLYPEPKNLVAHGLASARRERVGRRARTVYSITAKGRRALRRWLAGPSEPYELEFEAVTKVFFGEHGTKEDLLANIAAVRTDAEGRLRHLGSLALENDATAGGPFPERLHVNSLTFSFQWGIAVAMVRWSEWAGAAVARWDDVTPSKRKSQRALEDVYQPALGLASEAILPMPTWLT